MFVCVYVCICVCDTWLVSTIFQMARWIIFLLNWLLNYHIKRNIPIVLLEVKDHVKSLKVKNRKHDIS